LGGSYALERELGRGGMATVFLAHDLKHDRPVALKVLHRELAASLGHERLQREIRLAARLQHSHILTVLDSGEYPAVPEAGGRDGLSGYSSAIASIGRIRAACRPGTRHAASAAINNIAVTPPRVSGSFGPTS
jgi:serine/threonine protein kinase